MKLEEDKYLSPYLRQLQEMQLAQPRVTPELEREQQRVETTWAIKATIAGVFLCVLAYTIKELL